MAKAVCCDTPVPQVTVSFEDHDLLNITSSLPSVTNAEGNGHLHVHFSMYPSKKRNS